MVKAQKAEIPPRIDARTARFLLPIIREFTAYIGPHNTSVIIGLQERFSIAGLHEVFGDSFLYRRKAVIFTSEHYQDITPLKDELKPPYAGKPFTESVTEIFYLNGKGPKVLSEDLPIILAPLDTIVCLLAERKKGGKIEEVPKRTVARALLSPYELFGHKAKTAIDSVLDHVNVVGYRPAPGESLTVSYNRVLEHVRQHMG